MSTQKLFMKDSAFKLCPARKRVIGSLKMLDFAMLPAYNRHIEKALPIDGQPFIVNEVIAELLGLVRRLLLFCLYVQGHNADDNHADHVKIA